MADLDDVLEEPVPQDEVEADAIVAAGRMAKAVIERSIDMRSGKVVRALWNSDDHDKVAAALLMALTIGSDEGWSQWQVMAAPTLTDEEKAALAWSALMVCPEPIAAAVVEHHFKPSSFVPFMVDYSSSEHLANAEGWAEDASQVEIRSYVSAGIKKLPRQSQVKLRDWLTKRLNDG